MKQRTNTGTWTHVPPEQRFWDRVDRSGGETACWLWTGPVRNGYGYTTDYWKKIYAHRFAYELIVGPIPKGKFVCHRCDVKLCVNPRHLYAGTHTENTRDAVERSRHRRGESVAGAKLTADDIRAIRRDHGLLGSTELARRYGVSDTNISHIVSRRTWTHVD